MPKQKITTPEIIGIAINVFRNNGFHGTSMSKLAKACGLMKGSFYNHFDSKEDILLITIESLNKYLNERVFKYAYDESLQPEERLQTILEKLAKVLRPDQGGCLSGNMTLEVVNTHEDFRKALEQYFFDWSVALSHIYALKHEKELADTYAKLAIQEFEGAIMMGRIFKDPSLIDMTIKNIVARL